MRSRVGGGAIAVFIVVLFAIGAAGHRTPHPVPSGSGTPAPASTPRVVPSTAPSSPGAGACQGMEHVYHADRLQVLAPCVTVTGVIAVIRHEPDGDDHVLVQLDPGQVDPKGGNWLNAKNVSAQRGDLVTEPVCEHAVTQADAVEACQGYSNPQPTPAVGTHVAVTGPWVLDQQHGWLEIHPAVYRVL